MMVLLTDKIIIFGDMHHYQYNVTDSISKLRNQKKYENHSQLAISFVRSTNADNFQKPLMERWNKGNYR